MGFAKFSGRPSAVTIDKNFIICTNLMGVNKENEPFTGTSPFSLLFERSLYSKMTVMSDYTYENT